MEVTGWLRREEGALGEAETVVHSVVAITPDGSPLKRPKTVQLGGNLEVPDDGFSWLKYGQKHIRGTQNRRNYYRCSMYRERGCPAKKTIDFRPQDPRELRITQADLHNHAPRAAPPARHQLFHPLHPPPASPPASPTTSPTASPTASPGASPATAAAAAITQATSSEVQAHSGGSFAEEEGGGCRKRKAMASSSSSGLTSDTTGRHGESSDGVAPVHNADSPSSSCEKTGGHEGPPAAESNSNSNSGCEIERGGTVVNGGEGRLVAYAELWPWPTEQPLLIDVGEEVLEKRQWGETAAMAGELAHEGTMGGKCLQKGGILDFDSILNSQGSSAGLLSSAAAVQTVGNSQPWRTDYNADMDESLVIDSLLNEILGGNSMDGDLSQLFEKSNGSKLEANHGSLHESENSFLTDISQSNLGSFHGISPSEYVSQLAALELEGWGGWLPLTPGVPPDGALLEVVPPDMGAQLLTNPGVASSALTNHVLPGGAPASELDAVVTQSRGQPQFLGCQSASATWKKQGSSVSLLGAGGHATPVTLQQLLVSSNVGGSHGRCLGSLLNMWGMGA